MSVRDLRGFYKGQGTYDPNVRGICHFQDVLPILMAANAQNKSLDLQRKQGVLSEQRQKRELIRQARINQAAVKQSAESQGVASSSAAAGGQGSIQSQLGSNLSFLDQYARLSDQISKAETTANNWQAFGQVSQAITSAATKAYGA